jgi:uncharacterized protein YhbP (UPF0306 family)
MSGDSGEAAAPAAARAFLDGHHVLSLALAGEGGRPHACSLMYANDGFALYWLSDPAARHSRLIDDAGGRVEAMATVAPDYADFRQVRGVQLEGVASRAAGPGEAAAGLFRLVGRYAFLKADGRAPAIAAAMAKAAVYRFTARRATFIDNTVSFGSRATFRVGPMCGEEQ